MNGMLGRDVRGATSPPGGRTGREKALRSKAPGGAEGLRGGGAGGSQTVRGGGECRPKGRGLRPGNEGTPSSRRDEQRRGPGFLPSKDPPDSARGTGWMRGLGGGGPPRLRCVRLWQRRRWPGQQRKIRARIGRWREHAWAMGWTRDGNGASRAVLGSKSCRCAAATPLEAREAGRGGRAGGVSSARPEVPSRCSDGGVQRGRARGPAGPCSWEQVVWAAAEGSRGQGPGAQEKGPQRDGRGPFGLEEPT